MNPYNHLPGTEVLTMLDVFSRPFQALERQCYPIAQNNYSDPFALFIRPFLASDNFFHTVNNIPLGPLFSTPDLISEAEKLFKVPNIEASINFFSNPLDIVPNINFFTFIAPSISRSLDNLSQIEHLPENDYVTVRQEPIKEWELPESIAIPIGNHRFRIRTDLFISCIVLPILSFVAGLVVDLGTAANEAKLETERIEVEREHIEIEKELSQTLREYIDFLISTDSTNSSQAPIIESWKSKFQEVDSSQSIPDLDCDHFQET